VGLLAGARPFGVVPDLILVVVIYLAWLASASDALAFGLIAGLVTDFASGSDFGLRLAFYSATAVMVIFLRHHGAAPDNLWLGWVYCAVATLAFNLALVAGLGWAQASVHWPTLLALTVITAGVNCLLYTAARVAAGRWLRSAAPVLKR
jgi:cell shape-determining protein MreD